MDAETLEACAKLVEGQPYGGRYVTWQFWRSQPDGTRGNVDRDGELARHCAQLAAEIRALKD